MKIKIIANMVMGLFILTGCASIVSNSEWPVKIKSIPDQANVSITDAKVSKEIFKGKTPVNLVLSSHGGYFRGKTYIVQVSKEGFSMETIEIQSVVNGWYMGNFIFGHIPGFMIVDPLTGAMWTLEPKEINLTLQPMGDVVPNTEKGKF